MRTVMRELVRGFIALMAFVLGITIFVMLLKGIGTRASARWLVAQYVMAGGIVILGGRRFLLCGKALHAMITRDEREQDGQCLECGYDLTGNESGACPECGTPITNDE